mgnify:CR=1 FL=1
MEDGVNGHRGVIALNHVEGVRRIENDTVILQRHLQEEEIVLAPLLAVRGVTHKLVQVHIYSIHSEPYVFTPWIDVGVRNGCLVMNRTCACTIETQYVHFGLILLSNKMKTRC